eukprot:GHVL01042704.1.p2 GENE.GHVL01042704.1~~GHVL01042704.1.p2  ORF type:complete len:122 (+),score=25.77 GHVL01042704.1:368-733(+)
MEKRVIKEMQREYMQAINTMQLGESPTSVPIWMYVLLIILGWNEIMALISSPATIIFILIGGALGLVIWYTKNPGLIVSVTQQSLGAINAVIIPLIKKLISDISGGNQSPPRGAPKKNKNE